MDQMSDTELLSELARLRGPNWSPYKSNRYADHASLVAACSITQELKRRRVVYPKGKQPRQRPMNRC
jgi:hypothetical protein